MEQEQLALFDDPPHAEDAPMRRALLGGRAVEFRFQRRRRRSIGIRVNEQGLSVACLLYTSPSPRDISGSRMPSSA